VAWISPNAQVLVLTIETATTFLTAKEQHWRRTTGHAIEKGKPLMIA
jgi:hypothetical protein